MAPSRRSSAMWRYSAASSALSYGTGLPRGYLEGVAQEEHGGGREGEGAALQTPGGVVEVELLPLGRYEPVPRGIPPEDAAVDELPRGEGVRLAALEDGRALREDQHGGLEEHEHVERTQRHAFVPTLQPSPREYRLQMVTWKGADSTSLTMIRFCAAPNASRRNITSFPRVIVMFGGGYERRFDVSTISSWFCSDGIASRQRNARALRRTFTRSRLVSVPRELRAERTNSKVPGPVPSQIPAIQYPLLPSFRGNRETEEGKGQEREMGKCGCATKTSMSGKETPSKTVRLATGREITGRENATTMSMKIAPILVLSLTVKRREEPSDERE